MVMIEISQQVAAKLETDLPAREHKTLDGVTETLLDLEERLPMTSNWVRARHSCVRSSRLTLQVARPM